MTNLAVGTFSFARAIMFAEMSIPVRLERFCKMSGDGDTGTTANVEDF